MPKIAIKTGFVFQNSTARLQPSTDIHTRYLTGEKLNKLIKKRVGPSLHLKF